MVYIPPSKEELLSSINPDMKLTKSFIKRIYGYGVTDASFPDKAIAALEEAGRSKARVYYENWVKEYEMARDAELKEVSKWYRRECEREYQRRQKEGEEKRRQEIQSLTKDELTELCQKLLQEGTIERPEQFATAVLRAP